jgi:hypothetical protein
VNEERKRSAQEIELLGDLLKICQAEQALEEEKKEVTADFNDRLKTLKDTRATLLTQIEKAEFEQPLPFEEPEEEEEEPEGLHPYTPDEPGNFFDEP